MPQADMDKGQIRDRFRGCLLGLAIGDALGAPVEGMKEERVAELYGTVREYHPSAGLQPGEFTDDASLALGMAEAIIAQGKVDPDAIADAFLHWKRTDGRGIGTLTWEALNLLEAGEAPLDAGRLAWEKGGRRSAGNGAVMRCAPIALLYWRDQQRLVEDSIVTSQITHYDPRCTWSCVAVNTAIAALVRGESDPLAQARAAVEGHDSELEQALEAVETEALADMKLDGWDMGYTILTTKAAFAALMQFKDFEEGLVTVVSKGGDADTNGAVAGALLGARCGSNVLPRRLVDGLVGRERVTRAADGLFSLASD